MVWLLWGLRSENFNHIMPKCIICHEQAEYAIKDSSESYCEECAEEHFGDLSCLTKIEEKPWFNWI